MLELCRTTPRPVGGMEVPPTSPTHTDATMTYGRDDDLHHQRDAFRVALLVGDGTVWDQNVASLLHPVGGRRVGTSGQTAAEDRPADDAATCDRTSRVGRWDRKRAA